MAVQTVDEYHEQDTVSEINHKKYFEYLKKVGQSNTSTPNYPYKEVRKGVLVKAKGT